MIELIRAIAGMLRTPLPSRLLTRFTPDVSAIRQGACNDFGVLVLLLVNEGRPVATERMSVQVI